MNLAYQKHNLFHQTWGLFASFLSLSDLRTSSSFILFPEAYVLHFLCAQATQPKIPQIKLFPFLGIFLAFVECL